MRLLCKHHPQQWRCLGLILEPFLPVVQCPYTSLGWCLFTTSAPSLGPVRVAVRRLLERKPTKAAPQGESRTGVGGRSIPEPVNA